MVSLSLQNQFKIDFPYYGLFRTAAVKVVEAEGDVLYECSMLNGNIVCLKKTEQSHKWMEVNSGETPLSRLLGTYIDEHMGIRK